MVESNVTVDFMRFCRIDCLSTTGHQPDYILVGALSTRDKSDKASYKEITSSPTRPFHTREILVRRRKGVAVEAKFSAAQFSNSARTLVLDFATLQLQSIPSNSNVLHPIIARIPSYYIKYSLMATMSAFTAMHGSSQSSIGGGGEDPCATMISQRDRIRIAVVAVSGASLLIHTPNKRILTESYPFRYESVRCHSPGV